MRERKYDLRPWVGALAMAALILDGKTAVSAGADAVELCIRVLIPSLFPFFVFSPLLASGSGALFRPLAKLLQLPEGADSILLVSFLGGYPVGAAVTAQHYNDGNLSSLDARRMIAFCSNAGPSFIFGIGSRFFPNVCYCWLLWGIHITSAVLVGVLTPKDGKRIFHPKKNALSLTDALKNAITVMATVCGWVILFRILIAFLDRWGLWAAPVQLRVVLCGILELANGCCMLNEINSTGLRMILFCGFLGFGGLCVLLQTRSVTGGMDISLYLPGKVTQTAISILLCSVAQLFLPLADRYVLPVWVFVLAAIICLFYPIRLRKNENKGRNLCRIGV